MSIKNTMENVMKIFNVGRCVGCNEMCHLEGDACHNCKTSPERGEGWLKMARIVRKNPKVRVKIYNQLIADGKEDVLNEFLKMYPVSTSNMS